jgi:AP-1 complex subunit mu
MRAHFQLPSVKSEDLEAKPPIQVKFEIPYFTTSGIQVKQNFYIIIDLY